MFIFGLVSLFIDVSYLYHVLCLDLCLAVQFQGGSNVDNFRSSVLPYQQFSGGMKHSAAIGPTESFYPNTGIQSDNAWIQSTQMNEAMQLGNATYYTQFPGYSTEVVGSQYEPEGMQMSSYLSGFEPAFQSVSQSPGTGVPPGRNKEGSFQNPMRRQSYPPSGNTDMIDHTSNRSDV